ncbi:hypothetical protein [Paenibacillus albidus]|uniref:hypothetical protein n=1 Tax=Paenibacillus albidus TaxID=2041023 RepID=UPI00166AAB79|nr:hypothetical protein [Paenibacillus albidus]
MHTRRTARSRRAAYYLRTDEQQKRPDQPSKYGWLLVHPKGEPEGEAGSFYGDRNWHEFRE